MVDDATAPTSDSRGAAPREPLGHLSRLGFALRNASNLDEVVRSVLVDLVGLPGVRRVGVALSEGAGRRLRFIASDGVGERGAAALDWCHIDAYDDVPLTTVVRTDQPVHGSLEELAARFPDVVAHQREQGICAVAAWPLPGIGSPIGGIVLFFDTPQSFGGAQRRLLEATARRVSEAVARCWAQREREPARAAAPTPLPAPEPDEVRARALLDATMKAPSAARRFLRRWLSERGLDADTIDSAELAVSELVTNVVLHAGTPSELSLRCTPSLLAVAVRDEGEASGIGSTRPAAGPATESATESADEERLLQVYGRGLALVEAVSDRCGTWQDARGVTAWFELDLNPDDQSSRTA